MPAIGIPDMMGKASLYDIACMSVLRYAVQHKQGVREGMRIGEGRGRVGRGWYLCTVATIFPYLDSEGARDSKL
jgi:hypothetical protein